MKENLSLSGKKIFITGSTDGLGKAVAHEFAKRGGIILLHGRDPEKGQKILEEIAGKSGNAKLSYYNCDFSSLAAVQHLAGEIISREKRIDMLINNAGIGGGEKNGRRQLSADGYELRFAVNYLAPFLLTNLLLPSLRASAPSKIVNVVSAAQKTIDFSNVMLEQGYNGSRAYAQSKMALVMFSFDLAEKLKDIGITVNCLHPASMMNTKMVRESGATYMTTVEEGVDTVDYVATSPETKTITGAYFDHHSQEKAEVQAYDKKAREKLWELSVGLIEKKIQFAQKSLFG